MIKILYLIKYTLLYSIKPFLFSLVFLSIYFLFKYLKKKFNILEFFLVLIFNFLLISMLTITGFKDLSSFSLRPRINLILFLDFTMDYVQYLLNILLFIPFSFLICLIWYKLANFKDIIKTSFLFSLFIESMQMFGFGSSDINDLLMNTLGGLIGYILFKLTVNKKIDSFTYINPIFVFLLAIISVLVI